MEISQSHILTMGEALGSSTAILGGYFGTYEKFTGLWQCFQSCRLDIYRPTATFWPALASQ